MRTLLVLIALLAWSDAARAQIPSCGGVQIRTDVWPGEADKQLSGYSQSARNMDGCASKMRVEAWIIGATSGVKVNDGFGMAVSIYYSEPVRAGDRTALAKHWLITLGTWQWNGYSSDTAHIQAQERDCSVFNEGGNYYVWNANEERCVEFMGSPLLIDAARDGYKLTSVADGVRFDLDADGIPEQVAWSRADSDDAWLALDRNGNGVIDDGGELFGNATPAYAGQTALRASNGFDALGFLEAPDYGVSVADGQLTARDGMYGRLLLWTDRNHNGLSEPDELRSAEASGVAAIGTAYQVKKKRDKFGNEFRQKGALTWADGSEEPVYDVWLQRER
jgi:hypothetical protein